MIKEPKAEQLVPMHSKLYNKLLEMFWWISLYVTDEAIAKALCDVKFSQIEGTGRNFHHIELSNRVINYIFLTVLLHTFWPTLFLFGGSYGLYRLRDTLAHKPPQSYHTLFAHEYDFSSSAFSRITVNGESKIQIYL